MANISLGFTGPQVSQLQRQLEAAGYELGDIDGKFGRRTKAAVEAFQAAHGLQVDGVVGRKTAAQLRDPGDTFQPQTPPSGSNRVLSPAELRGLNNTRVDTQMPDRGYGFQSYYPANHRVGTERTVETMKTFAARYFEATGRTVRIGDISVRGGGPIPDHGAHRNGRNVDIDMQFSDGRTDIERDRNSTNATWRSPAYDRNATRRMIQELRRVNPNVDILFNDPVLVREGLVRPLANHDNHIHIQGLN